MADDVGHERCGACGSPRFVRIRIGGPDGFLRAQCVPCGRIRQPLKAWITELGAAAS